MKYGKYCINMMSKSVAVRKGGMSNIGDTFQTITMDHLFSQIGIESQDIEYINLFESASREKLMQEMIFPLYGGMFDDQKMAMPLPESVTPVFMSLNLIYDFFARTPSLLDYFKKYEPIGCRDEQTKRILQGYGIKAYLMGCFTVCVPKRTREPKNGKVFFVDVPWELNDRIPPEIKKDAEYVTHSIPFNDSPNTIEEYNREEEVARSYLRRYREEARLVVTGRIHAAIPCAAMGIPVILVKDNFDFRFGWVEKYLPLYTIDDIDSIDWSPAPVDMEFARERVSNYIRSALLGLPDKEKYLIELDAFYSDRNKAVLNKYIRKGIKEAFDAAGTDNMTYAIWGAGVHGHYLHDILQEMFPDARLEVVVDKYKKGSLYGVPIITGDKLKEYRFDHVFITTLPGKEEAVALMESLYGEQASGLYSVITSRDKS